MRFYDRITKDVMVTLFCGEPYVKVALTVVIRS